MKLTSLLIFLSCFSTLSATSCNIDYINTQVLNNPIYANFTQTKTIPVLTRPLISKGLIWMSPTGKLVWQSQFPIKSTMVVSDSGVNFYNKSDQLLPDNNHTMVKDISALFLNLLSGNSAKLAEQFEQSLLCTESSWKLDLEPKNKSLSEIMVRLSLYGSDSLNVIAFQEKRGDKTTIELFQLESKTDTGLEKYLE